MYPPPFDYKRPETLDEVLALLDQHGDEAKVMAGGQSLIPMLKLRFASPALLVDVNQVPGLGGIQDGGDGLMIGARTRHAELVAATQLASRWGVVAAAAPLVADPLVRNLGTIGGSVAHADPAGDWGSVLLALDATVIMQSKSGGKRSLPIRDFFKGIFWSELGETEVLTGFRVPPPKGKTGGAYLKLERKVGDFATVGTAVHLELGNGIIAKAGIALTAVAPVNLKVTDAEAALVGQTPSAALFEHAADLAAKACSPNADMRGSVEYKRNVVRVYVRRGLERALALAQA